MQASRIIYDLRNKLYRHLQDLSLGFFQTRPTGDLMSRVTSDVGALQQLVTGGLVDLVADLVTFVGVLFLLFYTDWRLTVFLLPTFPMMYFATKKFGGAMRRAYRRVQENIANVNDHLQQTISGAQVVKSFGNEDYEADRFAGFNRGHMDANMNTVRLWATFRPVIDLLTSLGTAIVLSFGAYRVMGGNLSVGTLVAFISYVHMVQRPVRRLTRVMNMIQRAAAAAERVFEILDSTPEVAEEEDAASLPNHDSGTRFENVSFSYDGENTVIHDFSLGIKPGETVAFVGPSGAGKSTIVNLLMRFYDPDKGRIRMGNHDVRNVTVKSLRDRFGVVSQEILLFNGSIRENIAYGRTNASMAQIEEASQLSNAADFIETLPQGYDTIVGERGIRLSGGQRQRIAIARAILKDPQILVFDEATSHLDSVSGTPDPGCTEPAAQRQNEHPHRTQAVDHSDRRYRCGDEGGPDCRERNPQGAAGLERSFCRHARTAVFACGGVRIQPSHNQDECVCERQDVFSAEKQLRSASPSGVHQRGLTGGSGSGSSRGSGAPRPFGLQKVPDRCPIMKMNARHLIHMRKSTSWIVITAVLGVCLAGSAAAAYPAEAQEGGEETHVGI